LYDFSTIPFFYTIVLNSAICLFLCWSVRSFVRSVLHEPSSFFLSFFFCLWPCLSMCVCVCARTHVFERWTCFLISPFYTVKLSPQPHSYVYIHKYVKQSNNHHFFGGVSVVESLAWLQHSKPRNWQNVSNQQQQTNNNNLRLWNWDWKRWIRTIIPFLPNPSLYQRYWTRPWVRWRVERWDIPW